MIDTKKNTCQVSHYEYSLSLYSAEVDEANL